MGVQMVSRGRYQEAIAVLEAVCEQYPFNESFIAGQVRPGSLAQGVLHFVAVCAYCCEAWRSLHCSVLLSAAVPLSCQ